MAKRREPRIGRSIRKFRNDFNKMYNYIMVPCPPPVGQTNGTRLKITTEEIDKLTDIKQRWDGIIELYDNKKSTRTEDVVADANLIIKEVVDLDRSNHIYNRIASNPEATTEDYSAFNIVGGTPLAAITHTRATAPGTKTVIISLKESKYLLHLLLVTSPDHKGRGKEEGVKEILIYKAVALITVGVPALNLYQYVGDVSNGLIKVTHEDNTQGMRAWYIGRIKNSMGEIGEPSEPVGFIII